MSVLLDFVVDVGMHHEVVLVHATCNVIVEEWPDPVGLDEVVASATDHACPESPSYSTLTPPNPHREDA